MRKSCHMQRSDQGAAKVIKCSIMIQQTPVKMTRPFCGDGEDHVCSSDSVAWTYFTVELRGKLKREIKQSLVAKIGMDLK